MAIISGENNGVIMALASVSGSESNEYLASAISGSMAAAK
jgi:hypothetical protein